MVFSVVAQASHSHSFMQQARVSLFQPTPTNSGCISFEFIYFYGQTINVPADIRTRAPQCDRAMAAISCILHDIDTQTERESARCLLGRRIYWWWKRPAPTRNWWCLASQEHYTLLRCISAAADSSQNNRLTKKHDVLIFHFVLLALSPLSSECAPSQVLEQSVCLEPN